MFTIDLKGDFNTQILMQEFAWLYARLFFLPSIEAV